MRPQETASSSAQLSFCALHLLLVYGRSSTESTFSKDQELLDHCLIHNYLGDEGARALGPRLARLTLLRRLQMTGNSITPEAKEDRRRVLSDVHLAVS